MKDGQRQVVPCSLTPFLLLLSLFLFFTLSLLPSPTLSCDLTDVEYTNLLMLTVLLLICALCVPGNRNRVHSRVCVRFGRRAACDHAYTWCIYTLFVSLSHQYAAEVKAGCDDPAMTGQLAVACLLVWLDNTLTHRHREQHRHPRFLSPACYFYSSGVAEPTVSDL